MQLVTQDFVRSLPKAELHLHLEGSIRPGRFCEFARRYATEYSTWDEERVSTELFRYRSFQDFLSTYRIVCEHLRTPTDYSEVLADLRVYLREQNIRYAEIIYTPSIPWKFGRDGREVLVELLKASQRIEGADGVRIRWILDCVRQWGAEPALQTAQLAAEFLGQGVVAIGLGGDETSEPAEVFEEVFAWARAHNLYAHVHAGETGGPQEVWDALKVLGANRIGHGIQAARDHDLMEYLRLHAVALDICLTSNKATGAWALISDNPFWLLHKRGVPLTLNSDDPGLFSTTLNEEYLLAARSFDLSPSDLTYMTLQSIRSSFMSHQEKMEVMQSFQNEIHELVT